MGLFKRKKKEEEKASVEETDKKTGKKGVSMKDLYAKKPARSKAPASGESKKSDTDKKKSESAKEGKEKRTTEKKAFRVLIKPLITEKVGDLAKENKYVFEVATGTNKIEVAQAVEEVYNIKPVKVNIIKTRGKRVRMGRIFGKRKDRKKAIVKLPEGRTISIHEGV